MLPSFERTSMRPVQKGAQNEAIGRSRGGLSTKIHIAANAAGHPLRILPTAGQLHEATQASTHPRADAHQPIADKGFDTDSFRDELRLARSMLVIPPMTRRTAEIACDANAYGDSLRPVDMIRLSDHVWMTGWAIDILNTGHDALPEFLLGCHPDVTQDRTCKLGKESLDGLSQEP